MNGKSFVFKMTASDLTKVVFQIFYDELFLRKQCSSISGKLKS